MNKTRAEALSDGVFAIVMTLLIFNIKVPVMEGHVTNMEVWNMLGTLWPGITSVAFTFLLVAIFWVNHNFLFHSFMKSYDRKLNLLNTLYLLFLVFVPLSANLVGTYPYNEPASLVYGLNILALTIMTDLMVRYIKKNEQLGFEVSSRLMKQATFRTRLSEGSYVLGIIASFVFIPASVFLYLFPLIFNFIPGTLDFTEKLFRFELK